MKNMFDYIFYRINKAYMRWDGTEGITSYGAITVAIMLYTLNFVCIILDFLGILKSIPIEFSILFIVIYDFILYKIIYRHYHGRYDEFAKKWLHEPKRQKTIRGIGVVLFLAMPFVIFIVYIGFTGTVFGVNFLGKY